MSESWHGIMLAEVKTAVFKNLRNNLRTVHRLLDDNYGTDFSFDTGANGAVIVTNNFMSWEFAAPNAFFLKAGSTVADLFDNLEALTTSRPVPAWDDFALFMNRNKDAVNSFLQNGAAATVKDASGVSYSGEVHQITAFEDFPDCVAWLKTWMGSGILAESSSVVYAAQNVIQFSLTSANTTISCTFKL